MGCLGVLFLGCFLGCTLGYRLGIAVQRRRLLGARLPLPRDL